MSTVVGSGALLGVNASWDDGRRPDARRVIAGLGLLCLEKATAIERTELEIRKRPVDTVGMG